MDATAYKTVIESLTPQIKIGLWTAQVSTQLYIGRKKKIKNIFGPLPKKSLFSWILRKSIFNKIQFCISGMWHIKIAFAPCTKRLFIVVSIPRESPKGNHFRGGEFTTFLKIDYTNSNCIKTSTVLLTSCATVFLHCYSVKNASVSYQGIIYAEGVWQRTRSPLGNVLLFLVDDS